MVEPSKGLSNRTLSGGLKEGVKLANTR